MFFHTTGSLFAVATLLALGGLGGAVWAQEAATPQDTQQEAEPPIEANLLEERAQPDQTAQGDSQETRMMYFTRNLSAQVLVNFLRGRSEFSAVRATPNRDTESVVLSGPEDKVREAVILIRRVDLVGRAVTDPTSAPMPAPMSAPQAPPSAEVTPRFQTVTYQAQNDAADTLAEKVRDRAADGVLPGVLAFVNKQSNSVILTGAEPELGMALDYLKRVDTGRNNTARDNTTRDNTVQANALQEPEQDSQRSDEPPAEIRAQLQAQLQAPSRQAEQPRQVEPRRGGGTPFRQSVPPRQAAEPEGPLKMIQLDLLLLALPADQTKRQSESIDQLSGPIEQVMERIDALTAEGEAKILNQFSLSTIENVEASVQVGQRTPRITGVQSRPTREAGRPFPNSVQTQVEYIGTLTRIQAKVDSEQQVLLTIHFEKSFSTPLESGITLGTDDEGGDIKATGIITMTLSQTVQVESGHVKTLAVSTNIDGEKSQSVRYVLVVGGTL